jgi:hypothetical protein
MNTFATHEKFTKEELSKLNSDAQVLELGIGEGSSPLMYEFCKNNPDATVQAFETDSNWFNMMYEKFGDLPNYIFNQIETWDDLVNHTTEKSYDFTFVDQAPWMARIESIDLLKDKCDLFILHDYDYFNGESQEWVTAPANNHYVNDSTSWLGQKYLSEFTLEDNYELTPPTLVLRKK